MPPVELPADAQAVWNRLAPDLIARRVLTAWDVDMFSVYCRVVALFNRAADQAANAPFEVPGSHGGTVLNPIFRALTLLAAEMRSLGAQFGLTPADRAQLKLEPNLGPKSVAERFLT